MLGTSWQVGGSEGVVLGWRGAGVFLRQALKPHPRVVSGTGGCAGCTH